MHNNLFLKREIHQRLLEGHFVFLPNRTDNILKDVEQTKYQLSAPVHISCSLECLPNFTWIVIMQAILLIGLSHMKGMKMNLGILLTKDNRFLHMALD